MTCPIWDGVPENDDLERRIFHSPRLNNARITLRPDALPELQGLGSVDVGFQPELGRIEVDSVAL